MWRKWVELEEAMKCLRNVLKMKDESNYVELGKFVLSVNKGQAVLGPVIDDLAVVATEFVDSPISGSWTPVA